LNKIVLLKLKELFMKKSLVILSVLLLLFAFSSCSTDASGETTEQTEYISKANSATTLSAEEIVTIFVDMGFPINYITPYDPVEVESETGEEVDYISRVTFADTRYDNSTQIAAIETYDDPEKMAERYNELMGISDSSDLNDESETSSEESTDSLSDETDEYSYNSDTETDAIAYAYKNRLVLVIIDFGLYEEYAQEYETAIYSIEN
jgi:hypothetical protein